MTEPSHPPAALMNMGNNDRIIYGELVKEGFGDFGTQVVTRFVGTTALIEDGITYLTASRD